MGAREGVAVVIYSDILVAPSSPSSTISIQAQRLNCLVLGSLG